MLVVDITFAMMVVGWKGTTAAMKLAASESKLSPIRFTADTLN
jgi:hypothetical protein